MRGKQTSRTSKEIFEYITNALTPKGEWDIPATTEEIKRYFLQDEMIELSPEENKKFDSILKKAIEKFRKEQGPPTPYTSPELREIFGEKEEVSPPVKKKSRSQKIKEAVITFIKDISTLGIWRLFKTPTAKAQFKNLEKYSKKLRRKEQMRREAAEKKLKAEGKELKEARPQYNKYRNLLEKQKKDNIYLTPQARKEREKLAESVRKNLKTNFARKQFDILVSEKEKLIENVISLLEETNAIRKRSFELGQKFKEWDYTKALNEDGETPKIMLEYKKLESQIKKSQEKLDSLYAEKILNDQIDSIIEDNIDSSEHSLKHFETVDLIRQSRTYEIPNINELRESLPAPKRLKNKKDKAVVINDKPKPVLTPPPLLSKIHGQIIPSPTPRARSNNGKQDKSR